MWGGNEEYASLALGGWTPLHSCVGGRFQLSVSR